MQRDVWGVFHDGILALIEGTVPGNLTIHLQIDYLRRQFDEDGDFFIVELDACTRFRYCEWDAAPTEDLQDIQRREIEVLSVASEDPLVLNSSTGTLELDYQSMRVRLPSGRALTGEDLRAASQRYWTAWAAKAASKAP